MVSGHINDINIANDSSIYVTHQISSFGYISINIQTKNTILNNNKNTTINTANYNSNSIKNANVLAIPFPVVLKDKTYDTTKENDNSNESTRNNRNNKEVKRYYK